MNLIFRGGGVKEKAFVAMLSGVCGGRGGEMRRGVNIVYVCGLC